MPKPIFSIITLSFDSLDFTKKFVNSIKNNTSYSYELIIVDNGSNKTIQKWVKEIADKSILFNENQGFAKGFNAGLRLAEGEYIMMANNDTEFPSKWDIHILENFQKYKNVGLVSPAYTTGSRLIALRKNTKDNQIITKKFGDYPSGVAYCLNYNFMVKIINGWCEDYPIASGEDADLCYKVWSKNYDIVIDERVLVIHEGKVTTKLKIKNWKKLWKKNAVQFRRKWFFYYFFKPIARIYVKIKYGK